MEGLIIIAVIWFVISTLTKGAKKAAGSGNRRTGEWTARPNPAARPRTAGPVRPAAPPEWSDIMTMLTGEQSKPAPQEMPSEEGVSTDYAGNFESLSGATLLEGAPTMMGDEALDYEGRDLPGERPAEAWAALPSSEEPAQAPARAFSLRRSPSAMREAVVWAEILAKPKALRRAVR